MGNIVLALNCFGVHSVTILDSWFVGCLITFLEESAYILIFLLRVGRNAVRSTVVKLVI